MITDKNDLKVYEYLKRARNIFEQGREEKVLNDYSYLTETIHIVGIAKMLQKEDSQ